jgi:hypothetical protein
MLISLTCFVGEVIISYYPLYAVMLTVKTKKKKKRPFSSLSVHIKETKKTIFLVVIEKFKNHCWVYF